MLRVWGCFLVCVWMQVGVWCSGPTMEEPFPLCGTLRQKSSLHPEPSQGFSALSFMNSLKIVWGDLEGTGWDSFLCFNPNGQLLYIQRQGGSGEKGCEREIKQVCAQLGSRKLGVLLWSPGVPKAQQAVQSESGQDWHRPQSTLAQGQDGWWGWSFGFCFVWYKFPASEAILSASWALGSEYHGLVHHLVFIENFPQYKPGLYTEKRNYFRLKSFSYRD